MFYDLYVPGFVIINRTHFCLNDIILINCFDYTENCQCLFFLFDSEIQILHLQYHIQMVANLHMLPKISQSGKAPAPRRAETVVFFPTCCVLPSLPSRASGLWR